MAVRRKRRYHWCGAMLAKWMLATRSSCRTARDDVVTAIDGLEYLRARNGLLLVLAPHVSVLVRAHYPENVQRTMLGAPLLGLGAGQRIPDSRTVSRSGKPALRDSQYRDEQWDGLA